MDFIVVHEAPLRLAGFVAVLAVLLWCERRWPFRGDARPARRQLANMGLAVIDTAVLRLAFPVLAVLLAASIHARGGGLLGLLAWPMWLEISLAVLVLDLAIYWQHRLLHAIPLLWPLHRVHHSDIAFDVSTGLRFHPLETALSMGIKLGLVVALGPHPAAMVIFELLLSTTSLFTHADFALPARLEPLVRRVLVTPSMHRIHHSVLRKETDSNYSFNLSLWDRLFGSYREHPQQPPQSMPIGLPAWRDPRALSLPALLLQPFRRES
jgi:sterol desaturase/sphingolipid hydroxylase (fatty acid hydroxylase superfamily)